MAVGNCGNLIIDRYLHYLGLPILLYGYGKEKVAIVVTIVLLVFFRSPKRIIAHPIKNGIYSPADGKILDIKNVKGQHIVCIYLSVLDVHVQYAPISGKIISQTYKTGEFNLAHILEKSDLNERLTTVLETGTKDIVTVVQIAGQLARRIESFVTPGDIIKLGSHIGVIKLGSRVDIHIPEKYVLRVKKNQYVTGGSTLIAQA